MSNFNPLEAKLDLDTADGKKVYYSIVKLQELIDKDVSRLPFSIKILLENVLRNYDGKIVNNDDILAIANWGTNSDPVEIPYKPSRVILQDWGRHISVQITQRQGRLVEPPRVTLSLSSAVTLY